MLNRTMKIFNAAVVMGALACGQASSADHDLSRDLELAGSESGLELAPSQTGTGVMSATERFAKGTPAPRATERSAVVLPRSLAETQSPVPDQSPTIVAEQQPTTSPEVQPKPGGTVMRRPQPGPQPQQGPPPGGWKSVGDVIRNAPFPINP